MLIDTSCDPSVDKMNMIKRMQYSKPEEGCDQEVHEVVYSQPKDVQQGVHIQFDSRPEQNPVWMHEKMTQSIKL